MSEAGHYFQFPLCVLAFGEDYRKRMSKAISYALTTVGTEQLPTKSEAEIEARIERYSERPSCARDFVSESAEHRAVVLGAEITSVNLGSSIKAILEDYNEVGQHVRNSMMKFGRDAEVRIRNDIVWDTFEGRFDYRLFSVLCAVLSVIGNKPFARVTRQMVRMRAMGYKNSASFSNWKTRPDREKPMTEKQIRSALDELERRGFFVRLNPSPRKAYFSHRMTRDEMVPLLAKEEARALKFKADKQKANQALRSAIEQQKALILCPNSH